METKVTTASPMFWTPDTFYFDNPNFRAREGDIVPDSRTRRSRCRARQHCQ